MPSVVVRKVTGDGGRRLWLTPDGRWAKARPDALEYATRPEALVVHAALIVSRNWPRGENPVVVTKG